MHHFGPLRSLTGAAGAFLTGAALGGAALTGATFYSSGAAAATGAGVDAELVAPHYC